MPQTLAQKILQAHTDTPVEQDGQIVQCRVSAVLANDITGPLAIKSFHGMGAERVFNRDRVILVMDHFTPQKDIDSANQVLISRKFAQEQNLTHYYEGGDCGVEHTLLPEQGLVGPGDLVIGADSHTCTYGALGAFSTGVGSTDMAAAMASGKVWLRVPEAIKVELKGQFQPHVSGKDLILHLIGMIGVDGALYQSLEFVGEGVQNLTMDDRLCVCNMAIEAGGKNGVFPVDGKTLEFLTAHGAKAPRVFEADEDAVYARTIQIDLGELTPTVSFPHLPENTRTFDEIPADMAIDQVVIGSCTNGRYSDFVIAADIMKDRKVDSRVRCLIIPATQQIYLDCMHNGLFDIFIKAGCAVSTPTCGPCLGGHMGILAKGERCVSTTNRNFVGRMGHPESEVYLASPAVAAASAILGRIAQPSDL